MSLAYILGTLLGRTLISYAVVLSFCWVFSRLRFRLAFARSVRWYSLLAVLLLVVLGTVAAAGRGGA